jgi:mannose-6-phosphate isomerase-like protein (cupin superfamily)
MIDFRKVVVQKPWGYEYLMYQNGTVGVWYLFIKHGARTSLHCHPHKRTGLIVLSGEAVVSFLNDSVSLKALSKLMIREGFFHSTKAASREDVSVIEIETPCDKEDLVRLEDQYGREDSPYEGPDATVPIRQGFVKLDHPDEGQELKYRMCDCTISMEKVKDVSGLRQRTPGEIIVFLAGGLSARSGEPVVRPGDVVSSDTLDRLAQVFFAPNGAALLTVRKEP